MHNESDYDRLKQELWDDTRRIVLVDNAYPAHCEGQGLRRHRCNGELELNHVIVPRNVFQKLPPELQRYFDDPINCALNCPYFHWKFGHTWAYERWHRDRVNQIYGAGTVNEWLRRAPLRVRYEGREVEVR